MIIKLSPNVLLFAIIITPVELEFNITLEVWMYKIVICEDNDWFLEKIEHIVTKSLMSDEHNYKTYTFTRYNKEFENIINESGNKIYILDIELLGNVDGISIARKIRLNDLNSVIIFITAHEGLRNKIFENQLLALEFIPKSELNEQRIKKALGGALKLLNGTSEKKLKVKVGKIIYKISFDKIVYAQSQPLSKKVLIRTINEEIECYYTIKELLEDLDERFIKTHRACIVNRDYINKVKMDEPLIYLENGDKIDLISRNGKVELKNNGF